MGDRRKPIIGGVLNGGWSWVSLHDWTSKQMLVTSFEHIIRQWFVGDNAAKLWVS